jgi:hypothetical protein
MLFGFNGVASYKYGTVVTVTVTTMVAKISIRKASWTDISNLSALLARSTTCRLNNKTKKIVMGNDVRHLESL